MSDIQTIHEKDDQGRQQTRRIVTIEDAAGQEYSHEFLATNEDHEYLGEGEPPESAIEALTEFEEDA